MTDAAHTLKPLLTPEGWELLNSLPEYREQDAFALNTQLREQGWPAETAAAALTQARLRRDAHGKFGEFASRMLFTEDGLQQATRLPVAGRHAHRLRAAGVTHVADLGCGMGGDAMAMASLGLKVMAVETDESVAAAATMNLLPFPEAEVLHMGAEDFMGAHGPLPEGWGLWLDPARRDPAGARSPSGAARRFWDPESFSPPLSFVTELAASGLPMGVKLGPGILHGLIPENCEAEWVSVDGEVVEVVLWFNAAARSGVRRAATVLRTHAGQRPTADAAPVSADGPRSRPDSEQPSSEAAGGAGGWQLAELTSPWDFDAPSDTRSPTEPDAPDSGAYEPSRPSGQPGPEAPERRAGPTGGAQVRGRDGLRGILWEPDGAVIRAGLVADLAAELNGHLLDEHIAYFCTVETDDTDLPPGTAQPGADLARGYRIREVMDFNMKQLRRWVRTDGVTSLEIKKRGVDVTPETLRKQLLSGAKKGTKKNSRTLVLIRIGEERVAAVVDPLPRSA